MPTVSSPADPAAWRWTDRRSSVHVAFFGRGTGTTAISLLPGLSPTPASISWLHQVHSARVQEARPGLAGEGDALVSAVPSLALAVATADCVPILFSDGRRTAAVHAGWRGLESAVIEATLRALADHDALEAWIGPAIGPCCYEIGTDVAERLRSVGGPKSVSSRSSGRHYADLPRIARHRLTLGGVTRIHQIDLCTRCEAGRLESYRRDGARAGRNWSIIWRV